MPLFRTICFGLALGLSGSSFGGNPPAAEKEPSMESLPASGTVLGAETLPGSAAGVVTGMEAGLGTMKLHTQIKTKLSWAPLEFLQKGYRNAPWVSDLFYPNSRGMMVSGIISDEMALINGKWLKVGDDVDGYKVKSIKPEGVTLSRRSELLLLKMRD